MAVFALIVPYNCYRRGVQVGDGRRKGIPKPGWFLERLQQHGLSHVLSTKHEAGTGRTALNERPSNYIVKLVPDVEFRGPLTPWDQECNFYWEYLNYPADAYSLRITSCIRFCVPVNVGFDRERLSKVVSTPGAPVGLDNASGFFVSDGQQRVMQSAELQLALGMTPAQWRDMVNNPLCFSVPHPVVELLGKGCWSKLMLAASWCTRKRPAMQRLTSELDFPSQAWLQDLKQSRRLGVSAPPPELTFSSVHAEQIAYKIREFSAVCLASLDEDERAGATIDLEQMVCRLESFAKQFRSGRNTLELTGSLAKGRRIDATTLVSSLAAAMKLRHRSQLKSTMRSLFESLFPQCELDTGVWDRVPSGATLSRSQLLVDAAFCCFMRRRFAEHHSLYLLSDSSPQAGYDYLLSTCLMIKSDDLLACSKAARSLRSSWEAFLAAYKADDEDRMAAIAQERCEAGRILKEGLFVHRLLPMAIGAGASDLEHKSSALARALFAETQTQQEVCAVLSRVVSVTTDLGTEKGFAEMSGTRLREILPSWALDGELEADADGGDGGDPDAEGEGETTDVYFLPRAVAVPGLNHITHNMCSDCNTCLTCWPAWLETFRPLVSLIHHKHLRQRYIATCLLGTRHEWMKKFFEAGLPTFAEWRWGSTVQVLEKLLPLKRHLQASWNESRFETARAAGQEQNQPAEEAAAARETQVQADVQAVTHAIRSNWFWSFGALIFRLNQVNSQFMSWAEGCPCHPWRRSAKTDLDCEPVQQFERDALVALEQTCRELGLPHGCDGLSFLPCPLAGLRACELASGSIAEQLQSMAELSKEDLLVETEALDEEQLSLLLEEFDRGKSHMIATATNKLQNWSMLPWRLAALDNPDQAVAREAAAALLNAFDTSDQSPELHHRLTWNWLKSPGSLREQLQSFIDGEALESLPSLHRTVAELSFIPTAPSSVSTFTDTTCTAA